MNVWGMSSSRKRSCSGRSPTYPPAISTTHPPTHSPCRPLVNVIDVLGTGDSSNVNNVSLERLKGSFSHPPTHPPITHSLRASTTQPPNHPKGTQHIIQTASFPSAQPTHSPTQTGQCELTNSAMERFVDENYTYLNGNVEAMGKILRKFNETFTDVKGLRQQVGG